MFGRASRQFTNGVHYQTKLLKPHQTWQPLISLHICTSQGRRLSSSITASIEDDEQEHISGPSTAPASGIPHQTTELRPTKSTAKFRTWHPQHVEKLGIDALGKPAEVIILPTRDRKFLQPAAQDGGEVKKRSVQQSLDLELRPASLEDVARNIDSLKVEIGGDKQTEFTATEWDDHRRRLADGFTKTQLQEYLRVTTDQRDLPTQVPGLSHANHKQKTAHLIMLNSWGWRWTDISEQTDKTELTTQSTTAVSVRSHKLEFILKDATQPLRHIAETFGVQVNVFSKKKRLELSGSAPIVARAEARLRELLNKIQGSTLKITDRIAELFRSHLDSSAMMMKLAQKHNLVIHKEDQRLRVVGYQPDAADLILRDFLMLSGNFLQTIPFTVWQRSSEDKTSQTPFYPEDLPEWLYEGKRWYRNVSLGASDDAKTSAEGSGNREARKLAKDILDLHKHDHGSTPQLSIAPSHLKHLKHEHHVNIGQVLFGRLNNHLPNQAATMEDGYREPSVLAPCHMLLPQVLANKEYVPLLATQAVKGGGKRKDHAAREFLLHLRLRPFPQGTHAFPFEVLLSGNDIELGLRQQLTIKSVVAITGEWRHNLLLPHLPVDIEVVSRNELSLFESTDPKPKTQFLKILQQIESILLRAQSSKHVEFPAIWKLDINSLYKPSLSKSHPTSSKVEVQSESTILNTEDSVTDDSNKILYVLDPPEFLDVATYTSSLTGEAYLEHITCDSGATERPLSRQILRIAQTPLQNMLNGAVPLESALQKGKNQQQKRLISSVGAAYDLAQSIHDAASSAGKPVVIN